MLSVCLASLFCKVMYDVALGLTILQCYVWCGSWPPYTAMLCMMWLLTSLYCNAMYDVALGLPILQGYVWCGSWPTYTAMLCMMWLLASLYYNAMYDVALGLPILQCYVWCGSWPPYTAMLCMMWLLASLYCNAMYGVALGLPILQGYVWCGSWPPYTAMLCMMWLLASLYCNAMYDVAVHSLANVCVQLSTMKGVSHLILSLCQFLKHFPADCPFHTLFSKWQPCPLSWWNSWSANLMESVFPFQCPNSKRNFWRASTAWNSVHSHGECLALPVSWQQKKLLKGIHCGIVLILMESVFPFLCLAAEGACEGHLLHWVVLILMLSVLPFQCHGSRRNFWKGTFEGHPLWNSAYSHGECLSLPVPGSRRSFWRASTAWSSA